MASTSSRISRQEEVNELFEQLDKKLPKPITILVIGGAAMMEYRLKDSTKDIDIVCIFTSGKGTEQRYLF